MSLESAYNTIEKLVNDFKNNERHYLASDYSESQARLDFIDKLFIALGWDVNHEHQKNPYEQEVKVERRVKDKEAQKRADYAFFLEPNYRDPKFYVEAKKPSRSLDNPYDYFQAIRYGWNAQTPLVVLTDFEEFHILDSRFKPDIKYTKERKVLSFHYSDYLDKEKFAKLYYLFSREAVGNGTIEKFAETMPKPRGKAVQKGLFPGSYQSIDESFLTELDEIRNTLARSFKKKNPALTSEELTEATQRTIDRLVFIRFLEDMLIEGEHHISSYGDKGTSWGDFIADCRSLNAKYNGIVFKEHFIDRLPPSKGGSAIAPDDKDFADICEELSHVNSPYNFNSIPIHILGSIYERFLGKVVHATEKRVTIEEKPEVRKAGGVYYTPQYIVQYIVNNTVGKLIEGKTPTEIAKLRFADISCGSGSFLITVYDTLLRYHSRYYQQNAKEAKSDGCILSNGLWVLSLKQKRQILLNNVYGVDIDHQAVEVTQLSLYLKLLEDETLATANEMQAMFKEKILPDLSKNIICGNSLIGTDIYDGNMFPSEEEKKINAMNFEDAFPAIMKNGGFDAIVGNPPYISSLALTELYSPQIKNYLKTNYETTKGTYDIYIPFFEKSFKITKYNGFVAYITPNKYLSAPYGVAFRDFVVKKQKLISIYDFSQIKVFDKPSVYPIISVFQKNVQNASYNFKVRRKFKDKAEIEIEVNSGVLQILPDNIWGLILSNNVNAVQSIVSKSDLLENIASVNATTTAAEADEYSKYIKNKASKNCLKLINTGTISRYYSNFGKNHLTNKGAKFLTPYLDINDVSEKRRELYTNRKIIIAKIALRLKAFLDFNGEYASMNTNCVYNCKKPYTLFFLTAVLNSRLISFVYSEFFSSLRMSGGYYQFQAPQLRLLPIIKFNDQVKEEIITRVDELVLQIISNLELLSRAITDKDKNYYENKCNTLDRQIDRLVYELYGLTEEEIKIVEGE